jgi:gas vesicle protein
MANRSGLFVGGFLVGAALGSLGGLLFAPRSGQETRKLLRKSADALPELAEDLTSMLQLHADRLSDGARHRWDDTLERLQLAIADGIAASQQQRQVLQYPESQYDAQYAMDNDLEDLASEPDTAVVRERLS